MSKEKYDSTIDTRKHIQRVGELISIAISELEQRALQHDKSKLEEPEKSIFDNYSLRLADTQFGSPEYEQLLKEIEPATLHHYAVNRHHPEHYQNGINDMTLFDVIEMFMDWKASSERRKNAIFSESIRYCANRFHISD